MGESKTTCPICAREPGERHHDECPRSQRHQRDFALGQKLYRRLSRVNYVWISSTLIDKPIKGSRRAIARYKNRRRSHPIEVPITFETTRQLHRVPYHGTYVRRLHAKAPDA